MPRYLVESGDLSRNIYEVTAKTAALSAVASAGSYLLGELTVVTEAGGNEPVYISTRLLLEHLQIGVN